MRTRTARRRLPPVLTGGLAFLWLVLNQTVSPGQVLLAVAVGVALAWVTSPLRPLQSSVRNPHVAAMLLLTVLLDVVRSNFAVARIVLGRVREVEAGFLDIPLDMRDPHGLAALAMIVTSLPGTVWVDLAADSSRLTLHILDLRDEGEWIRWIKNRYERPLMRIFE